MLLLSGDILSNDEWMWYSATAASVLAMDKIIAILMHSVLNVVRAMSQTSVNFPSKGTCVKPIKVTGAVSNGPTVVETTLPTTVAVHHANSI